MICRRCGEDFEGVICTNCGLPYTAPATPEPPTSPMPAVPPVQSEQSQPYAASPAPFSPMPPVPPAVPEQPLSSMPPANAGPYTPQASPFSSMPPFTPYPAPAEKNSMATVSMVLGIVALVFASTILLPLVLGTLAIAFGTVSMSKKTGKGKAIAGVVCSTIAIALTSLLILSSVGSLSLLAEDFGYYEDDFGTGTSQSACCMID